jgi:hypothetical protein
VKGWHDTGESSIYAGDESAVHTGNAAQGRRIHESIDDHVRDRRTVRFVFLCHVWAGRGGDG